MSSPAKGQFALLFNDITKRKKAEEERYELLNRFQQIAKHIPGFIYQYHLRTDNSSHFPYASEAIKDIYGVSKEQAMWDAQCVFDVLHPDDLQRVSDSIMESARNLTLWNDRYRVNLPTGKTIWVEGKSTPIKLDDGSVLWHGYIHDISKGLDFVIRNMYEFAFFQINSDRQIISKIYKHLLDNAIKFTSKGKIEIGASELDASWCLYVSDTGTGISESIQQHVLKPFVQADMGLSRTHEGLGVGLTIVKGYVDLLGGELKIESGTGTGSKFSVYIPKSQSYIKSDYK